jgi:hypothetical protein
MEGQRVAHDTNKRRSLRSSSLLGEYLTQLDDEHVDLAAQREHIQTMLDLLERQKANLLEVIDIEGKLADLRQRIGVPTETPSEDVPEDSQRQQEVVAS